MKELQIKAVIKDDGELSFTVARRGFENSCSGRCEIAGILEQIKKCELEKIEANNLVNRRIDNVDDR